MGKPVRVQIPPSAPSQYVKGIWLRAKFPFYVFLARGSNLGPAGLFEEERGEYLSRPGYFHRKMDFISGLDFDAVHRQTLTFFPSSFPPGNTAENVSLHILGVWQYISTIDLISRSRRSILRFFSGQRIMKILMGEGTCKSLKRSHKISESSGVDFDVNSFPCPHAPSHSIVNRVW